LEPPYREHFAKAILEQCESPELRIVSNVGRNADQSNAISDLHAGVVRRSRLAPVSSHTITDAAASFCRNKQTSRQNRSSDG